MECCFRSALLIVSLIGLLQAKPIIQSNLSFKLLNEDVFCNDNVTFQSPTNIMKPCYEAALNTIKDGLEYAKTKCTNKNNRLDLTLDVLDRVQIPTQGIQFLDCKWENKTFVTFVKHFEDFTELVNSQ